jgi:diadenylate cyclase
MATFANAQKNMDITPLFNGTSRAKYGFSAVVIEGNRIKAASCILPLPKHTHVDSELGTRHRAAVGMSEISDALIIVVSEETGTISIAYDGELKRNQNYQTLKQTLTELCVRK